MASAGRKLVVEVCEAHDLLPKDGHGFSSPYAVVDFRGQRRRTRTVRSDLNPVWNDALHFLLDDAPDSSDPDAPLEVELLHDRRVAPTRRSNFLGRIRIGPSHFVRRGEEALVFFQLQSRGWFSWVRGQLGLRIYYILDEPQVESVPPPPAAVAAAPPPPPPDQPSQAPDITTPPPPPDQPSPAPETAAPPPPPSNEAPPYDQSVGETKVSNDAQPPQPPMVGPEPIPAESAPPPLEIKEAISKPTEPVVIRQMTSCGQRRPATEAYNMPDLQERPLPRSTTYDLVEKMQYLFVRIVKVRGFLPDDLPPPVVKISVSSGKEVQSNPGRPSIGSNAYEWDQTFAFGGSTIESAATLEVSVWRPQPASADNINSAAGGGDFLGGVCFDVSDVPNRDQPDSPLAPLWYRLEGAGVAHRGGDIMLATWAGTQADESFSDAWKTDAGGTQESRAKVYLSPKLWYMRATVVEAQDLTSPLGLTEIRVSVRAQLGFQILKTRTAATSTGTPVWNDDLLFVASEPFADSLLLLTVEMRTGKEKSVLGTAEILLNSIERRVDDRKVVSRWVDLSAVEGNVDKLKPGYAGRLHIRTCFDGGYHVMDEPAHSSSDFRPTARQLWKPPVGTVALGIIGCRNLIPVKAIAGKGTADSYVVAKYGPKWIRSRTVSDSLSPRWNEQYTWQVYDPCTVLTVAVFDNGAQVPAQYITNDTKCSSSHPDIRIGRVRIRISTLESGKAYKCTYPLLLLLPMGARKMGEIELGVRFTRSAPTLDMLHVYAKPILPRMHYLKPIGMAHQDLLRNVAARIIAVHLAKSEPPLPREVTHYMLDSDSHGFSMRKVRANWSRIVNVLTGPIKLLTWLEDIRTWKNPTSTAMVHAVLILLIWHPDLMVPTLSIYTFAVGVWNYRGRTRGPSTQICTRLSYVDAADKDELDEEFDTLPSSRPIEVTCVRYDKLRMVGAKVQTVLGDLATQGERVQALMTWQDPRATFIFVGMCLLIALFLYVVPAKMAAVATGFYYLRHPIFRDRMPPPVLNFFRRLPSLGDRIL